MMALWVKQDPEPGSTRKAVIALLATFWKLAVHRSDYQAVCVCKDGGYVQSIVLP